jgi:hypothetical protein
VLDESVKASLLRSNYNHPGDIAEALDRVGLPRTLLDPVREKLGSMMGRRHWIVHRADRHDRQGPGHFVARSLQKPTVERWLAVVKKLGEQILVHC